MYLLLPIPFSIIACYTDFKSKKIKNYVTYPLVLLGIFFNTFFGGFEGFKGSILGIIITVLVISLIPAFKLGGGDLKLAMGYGAFLLDNKILYFLFFFILLIVIGSSIYFIINNGLSSFIARLKLEIKTLGVFKIQLNKLIGAPFLLGAYILTILTKIL